MQIKKLHNWNLSIQQAVLLQEQLARSINFAPIKSAPQSVAGLDCSLSKDKTSILAVVVVLSLPGLEVIETAHARLPLVFPYIPGLLSFREAPACIKAVRSLKSCPDVFIVDGQGIAHPRRLGLASHLGLFFDKPTIGCAKSRLIGSFEPPGPVGKGCHLPLIDKGRTIGAVLCTRDNTRPLFISVGHKCRLDDCIGIVLDCTTRYRLPQPTRLAHILAARLRTGK